MIFIFPLLGIIFAAADVIISPPYSMNIFGAFAISAVIHTLIFALCFVAFFVIMSLFVDLEKPNEKFSRFYNFVAQIILKVALSACNVRVKTEGFEKIPEGRFVMVQNHLAMFDPIVTIAYLAKYEIGFISKPENLKLPVINKFMHRICSIPIDRENPRNAMKAINTAAEFVKNDVCSMLIYPEGTRSRNRGMLPFHAGSFKIATKAGAPLVITTVSNTNMVHKNAPWKRTDVTLRVCEVISAEEVLASSTSELSKRAKKAMCESLGISYTEE